MIYCWLESIIYYGLLPDFLKPSCKFDSATPAPMFLNVSNGKKFENTLTRLTVTGHKDHITQTFKGVKIEPRISLSVEIS